MFCLVDFLVRDTSSDPLTRWGLKHPCEKSLKVASCTFSAYHAVKAEIRANFSPPASFSSWTPSRVREHWNLFAQSFLAEAGEAGVDTHAFSFPKYFDFLLPMAHAKGGLILICIACIYLN